ncbi:hypothetical protein EUGRSUZ_A02607 [Eucalyptus grandis]|uniref:Uncharacterized protein n=2 Tax=Eucalyptus grandis TaxID=71139 RepID=A0ACC3M896_EUCGR|nr:hypothetical protein EUGRSUZ_A02607 [Eucalyptus grandis]
MRKRKQASFSQNPKAGLFWSVLHHIQVQKKEKSSLVEVILCILVRIIYASLKLIWFCGGNSTPLCRMITTRKGRNECSPFTSADAQIIEAGTCTEESSPVRIAGWPKI